MSTTSSDGDSSGQNEPRVPWYRNPNWLLLAVVVVVGVWLFRLFASNQDAAQPGVPGPKATAHVYQKPIAPASIVQHGHASGDHGVASATDLTVKLAAAPKVGDVLLAFGSTGFGCVPAPGWTLVGGKSSDPVAVAYRIAQAGDGEVLVPFTTSRPNEYTLDLIEVAGGPDILASAQAGGYAAPLSSITNRLSLAVPQSGGVLFQLDAGSSTSGGNGPPITFVDTVPTGQQQVLVDHVPARGWASELLVRATTTEPRNAKQPFVATQTMTFAGRKAPGNTVTGWLVWVGGQLVASP